ncbi:CsbD family protein [Aurantimonas sp. 22II-16-19i]|uniref:CsbD family protein n=1 Tax=Aurantimonas sp. 22II-16-19i TaxID=1317114 RepID=UPI0009F7E82C|nr:CsbD family protein [Aurantimonas sp. 22II-16-19i]ORE98486.1 CsbD-like protein [Aurantimonas sp. 22II-16-19i]
MADHQTKGTAKEIGGKIKETVGNATGDREVQNEGTADRTEGKTEKNYGKAKDAIKDQFKN